MGENGNAARRACLFEAREREPFYGCVRVYGFNLGYVTFYFGC